MSSRADVWVQAEAEQAGLSATPRHVGRFEWEKAFRASGLKPLSVQAVGWYFATYASTRNGDRMHPGITRAAKDLGVNERTVRRSLEQLRDAGWFVRIREGNSFAGTADEYAFAIPASGHSDGT